MRRALAAVTGHKASAGQSTNRPGLRAAGGWSISVWPAATSQASVRSARMLPNSHL